MRIDIRTKALEDTNNGVMGVATVTFGNSFAVRNISIVRARQATFLSLCQAISLRQLTRTAMLSSRI